jgi:hypothetical protein
MSLPIDLTDKIAAALTVRLAPIVAANNGSGAFDTAVTTNAVFPRIIFAIELDTEDNATPQDGTDYLVSVKVISQTGFKQANKIDGQIRAALHNSPLIIEDAVTYSQMRINGTPRLANPRDGGGHYYQVGGVYRIRVIEEKP